VRGFGLLQRDRNYDSYDDYHAAYDRRPSLWVEPVGDWGQGSVVLVEIPSESEVNDNIVAYWQPKDPIRAGSEFAYAYHMAWGNGPDVPGLVVASTRRGRGDLKHPSAVRRFVLDYVPTGVSITAAGDPAVAITATAAAAVAPAPAQPAAKPADPPPAPAPAAVDPKNPPPPETSADPAHDPKPVVTASAGVISDIWVEPNPASHGWRVTFNLDPQDEPLVELRVELHMPDGSPADTWLYRWTA
jgi:glucans biosynthesis protein